MKKIQRQKKVTLDDLYAYLHESTKEYKKERAEYRRERARENAEYRLERAKERAEFKQDNREFRESEEKANRELKESIKETDRQLKESMAESSRQLNEAMEKSSRELNEAMKKTDEKIYEVSRQLGTIGNSNGDMAEEYFQSAFTKDPRLNGEVYDEIDFNLKLGLKKGQVGNEYDIVMANGKSVAIIEIKYHLKKDDVKEELSKISAMLETFKAFYPEYANHKFYLGIASLSFRKNIEKILQEKGIAVIKQVGDKMVINSDNLKIY